MTVRWKVQARFLPLTGGGELRVPEAQNILSEVPGDGAHCTIVILRVQRAMWAVVLQRVLSAEC